MYIHLLIFQNENIKLYNIYDRNEKFLRNNNNPLCISNLIQISLFKFFLKTKIKLL